MDEMKFLPCPFCGGEAYIDKFENGSPNSAKFNWEFSIECKKCFSQTGYHKGELEAIKAWNRRV